MQDADAVVGGHLQQEGVLKVGGRRGPPPRRHVAGVWTRLRPAKHWHVSCQGASARKQLAVLAP